MPVYTYKVWIDQKNNERLVDPWLTTLDPSHFVAGRIFSVEDAVCTMRHIQPPPEGQPYDGILYVTRMEK